MKEIDFSKIQVKDIEDKPMTVDLSKELGNMMYFGADDIAVAELGKEIYTRKKIEVTKEKAAMLMPFIGKFKAFVKQGLLPLLESIE